jgi:hypothetical protein
MDQVIDLLKQAGLTPIEIILAVGLLYLFREQVSAKRELAVCYQKMNKTLSELPKQIMSMAVSFQEHRSDGIHVTGDAVISGRDMTKSDVSYEPIIPKAVREEAQRHDDENRSHPDVP